MSASLVKQKPPPKDELFRIGPREVQGILGGAVIMCPACKVEYLILQRIADLPKFDPLCSWCTGQPLCCSRCGAAEPDHVCEGR